MLIGSGLSEHEENGVNEGSIAQDERNKSQKPSKTPSYGGKFKKSHISTKIQRIIIATEKYRDRSLRLLKNNKPCKKAGFIVNLKRLRRFFCAQNLRILHHRFNIPVILFLFTSSAILTLQTAL